MRYKNSVLGIAWSLLNPILMMLVFTLVYTVMLGQSNRRDYAAFILCGLLPWNFFSGSIMGGIGSIVNNGYLIKKVYFPRVVLPTSIMLSNLVNFLVALPVYFVLAWLLGVRFTPYVLFLPIVMLVEMIFILGVSLLLSAVNVFYRDVQQIMEVVILAWFFLTPVIWDVNPAARLARDHGRRRAGAAPDVHPQPHGVDHRDVPRHPLLRPPDRLGFLPAHGDHRRRSCC